MEYVDIKFAHFEYKYWEDEEGNAHTDCVQQSEWSDIITDAHFMNERDTAYYMDNDYMLAFDIQVVGITGMWDGVDEVEDYEFGSTVNFVGLKYS